MGLKDIGRKIGDAAFRLAVSGYGCGKECGKCGICGTPPSSALEDEKAGHRKI